MSELWILVQYTTYFSWSRIKRQMIVWKLKNVSRRTATKKELTKWHAFTTHNCIFLKKRQCSCNAKGILLLMMRGKEVHSNLNWISHGYPSTSSSASCMKNQGQILYMNSSDHAVSPTADLLFFLTIFYFSDWRIFRSIKVLNVLSITSLIPSVGSLLVFHDYQNLSLAKSHKNDEKR